jgi:chaperone protein EcpD
MWGDLFMRGIIWHIVLLCLISVSFFSSAGVVLTGTRVIYPMDKKEVIINLRNTSNHAMLLQSWIDVGDPMAMPEKINAPFVIMPPVARINGLEGKSLRIIYTGGKPVAE